MTPPPPMPQPTAHDPESSPMVSVIIVSWNHATWLPECVSSLRGQSGGIPVEIIVVDSGSHDRTLEVADSLGARVVACENHGFAYANDRGLEHVTGESVSFSTPTRGSWREFCAVSSLPRRRILGWLSPGCGS